MVDVSAVTYFAPLLAFLLMFVIMATVLYRTEVLGKSLFVNLFVSFLIATVFVAAGSVRQVVLQVIPWIVILVLAGFFMLVLAKFIRKDTDKMFGDNFGWIFVAAVIIIFLVSAIKVFSSVFAPYLPGPYYGIGGDPQLLYFFSWLYSPPVFGAALLLIVGGIISYFLTKGMKS